jgi:hypothetical protein
VPLAEWLAADRGLGRRLEEVSPEDFMAALVRAREEGRENALHPLMPILEERRLFSPDPEDAPPEVDDTHAREALGAAGIVCPEVDRGLLELYLQHLDET